MKNIKIAFEPEVVILFLFNYFFMDKEYKKSGKIFMLVDAGENSIDITLNEIMNEQGNSKQLLSPFGNPFGSMEINKDILRIVKQVISEKTLKRYKKIHLMIISNFQSKFNI